jgi:molybdopterin/thiamine biosynthesis adenylyltransferase/rhodanese-related sulfurtransferase
MVELFSHDEIRRYSRHLLLPDVGLEGQRKLKQASVLIVGVGGLGSPVALYLAAAGIGRIGVVDYDRVDSSNLQRQIIHGTDRLGQLKVDSARQRMLELNPFVQVDVYHEALSSQNAGQVADGYQVVVDGTDNFPTRYLINDLCVMTGKPFVYGSVYRFEGQVSVFDARFGPCYRCLFPDPPPPGAAPSCADGGVLGVVPGTIGTLQTTEVVKLILGIGAPLFGVLLLYDALEMTFQNIQIKKNSVCKVCGQTPEITHLIDYEAFCGVLVGSDSFVKDKEQPMPELWDISPHELAERLRCGEDIQLVDVREAVEQQVSHLPGARLIPLDQLARRMAALDRSKETILFCRTGGRSRRAAVLLHSAGFERVRNLAGGINAWAREVDPTMLEY